MTTVALLIQVRGVHDDHGHHRDAAFLGYLEASLPEREEGVVHFVAGALREDAQGDAALDLLHAIQDRFQALLDIVPVQEQAVDVAHPVHQQRVSCHLLLRHIAGQPGENGVGEDDVEIAAVVAHEQDGAVGGDILPSLHDDLRACQEGDAAEAPAHHRLGALVFQGGVPLPDEPFRHQHRDGKDQEQEQIKCH